MQGHSCPGGSAGQKEAGLGHLFSSAAPGNSEVCSSLCLEGRSGTEPQESSA